MPSIEAAVSSPASSEHPDRLLFKSHKSLPRRTNANNVDGQIAQLSPLGHNGEFSAGLPLTTAPILPLTPPGITQDESPTGPDVKHTHSHSAVTLLTPSKPSHPPTPETTPPRDTASSYRPGRSQYGYMSSSPRAESFQTAYEIISDTETATPRPLPPSLSHLNTQRSTKSTKSNEENDRFDRSARTRDSTRAEDQSPSFRDSSRSKSPSGTFLQSNEKQSPMHVSCQQESVRKAPELGIKPTWATPKHAVDVNVAELDASTRGRRSLRDRVAHVQHSEDSSAMDRFRQEIGWPSPNDQSTLTELEEPRRLSGASTSSTVEAMIIDTRKPARRALRHTEKRSSLRSVSSPITRSERTSIASSVGLERRLSHKPARITENDRRSIASEMSISGSSTLVAPQRSVDVVPVVVIPQRRSSLKGSSNSTSKNPSVSHSRPSSHAPTAPESRPGSLNLPCRRKRTVSDSHASNNPANLRGRLLSRPCIPPRSSSLSAHTSQNNSRATSLTSESLRSHNLAVDKVAMKLQAPEQKAAPIPVPVLDTPKQAKHDATDLPQTQSILIGVEDLSHLRPPSVPFTPHSIPSTSPGPFEINEVKRVAIFPHNNESLLLVNPHGQSSLRQQVAQANQPQTPDIIQQYSPNVDSPLKNPRPPPQPPVSTAPVNTVSLDQIPGEVSGELGPTSGSKDRPENTRRGRVVRPRSESFNSFVRTLSLSSARNPKAGKDIDGRLQPFWRPRRFWDDSPDSLSPEDNGFPSRITKQPDEVINNSLGMPQKRIVFDGPSLSTTRSGQRRRIDGYHGAHRESLVGSRIFTPEALYSQTSLNQRQFPTVSWWRLRFRSGIARSLRWRFRRSMQQRAEGKREVRREKLKQSIGEAVVMDSSTQVRKAIQ